MQSVANVLGAAIERKAAEESIRQAKEEADRANHAKSEFLSRMSHDLRTPLNAILGFGQLLQRAPLEPKYHERMNMIVTAGHHLLDLINEVLDISRVESGHTELNIMPVSAGLIMQQVLSMVQPLATEQDVTIDNMMQHESISVLADAQRVRQVLFNLLSNAIKYNRPGGRVMLRCSTDEHRQLRICVEDIGRGIPADMLPRLFTPFDRLDAERTDIEGTGLGLALSRQLIEVMGGTIEVWSTPGVGSVFTITLPLAASSGKFTSLRLMAHPAGQEAFSLPQSEACILYIEDNLSNQKLIEEILSGLPCQLLTAAHGEPGLELARQHRLGLILLDMHLPDISGGEVLQRLQADSTLATIPVLVLSADVMSGQAEQLQEWGARQFLTKPVQVELLLQTINDMLSCNHTPCENDSCRNTSCQRVRPGVDNGDTKIERRATHVQFAA